jgi:hypothetical protein
MDLRIFFDFSHSTLGVAATPARLPQLRVIRKRQTGKWQ